MSFYGPFLETDPSKKNAEWMTQILTQVRTQSYRPLVDPILAKERRDIILSNFDMGKIRQMFKKPDELEKAGFEFIPIAIMEKIKNILVGEKLQQPIKAEVNAQDPSMEALKKDDMNLLKNKKIIESQVNQLKKQLGLPPEQITNDDFNGNYDQFKQMGLDESNGSDIDNFFETHYQLDIESDYQTWVNHVFNTNDVNQYTNDFIVDIQSVKKIAFQQFVNKTNGCTEIRRLDPADVFIIKGQNKINQKGDVAVGYYEEVTVSEFMKRCGPNFDFLQKFQEIFDAVNYHNNLNITGALVSQLQISGVYSDSNLECIGSKDSAIPYTTLLNYKVRLGYIEIKSVDIRRFKQFTNKIGNEKIYEFSPLKVNDKDFTVFEDSPKERTYKTNFLATSTMDQYVFNNGLLFSQEVEGIEDQYSNFSIKYVELDGKTIAEIAKGYIVIAQEAFNKLRYMLRKARPDGRSYSAEALKNLSEILSGKDGQKLDIMSVYEMLDGSENELFGTVRNLDGSLANTQGGVNYDIKRPIDSKFKSFVEIINWAVESIKQDIGLTDLRAADEPKTNDVNKLEQTALQKSNDATYYIDYMMDYAYKNMAITSMSFLQYSIIYEDKVVMSYVKNIIGEEGIKRIKSLPKISPHRIDIFVSSMATVVNRNRVLKDAQIAFEKGLISYIDKMLVDSIDNYKKAQKVLIYREDKQQKDLAKIEQQKQQNLIALQKQKTEDELRVIDRRGGWELKKAEAMAKGYRDAAEVNAKVKLGLEDKKAENEKSKKTLESQLKGQEETYK